MAMMKNNLHIRDSKDIGVGSQDIEKFIRSVDRDFYPTLSSKVDLKTWSEKLNDKAMNLLTVDSNAQNKIVGILSVYCNDFEKKFAYIPLIGVLEDYRKQGIAKALLIACFSILRQRKFAILGLKTRKNSVAAKIYQAAGFRILLEAPSPGKEAESIYLEKLL